MIGAVSSEIIVWMWLKEDRPVDAFSTAMLADVARRRGGDDAGGMFVLL